MISEQYKKNVEQLKDLLSREDLTPVEIKAVTALEVEIKEYESKHLSKDALKIVKVPKRVISSRSVKTINSLYVIRYARYKKTNVKYKFNWAKLRWEYSFRLL